MSTLDIIYIGIMVVALTISSFRGGIREVFSLVSVFAGFMLAANFYHLGTGYIFRITSHENVNNIISFIAIFLFTTMLISYVGGHLSDMVKKASLGFWNLMAGTAIGFVKGLFVCSLLTYALLVFMKPGDSMFTGSKAFPIVSQVTLAVAPIGPAYFREELDKKLDALSKKALDKVVDTAVEKGKKDVKAAADKAVEKKKADAGKPVEDTGKEAVPPKK